MPKSDGALLERIETLEAELKTTKQAARDGETYRVAIVAYLEGRARKEELIQVLTKAEKRDDGAKEP